MAKTEKIIKPFHKDSPEVKDQWKRSVSLIWEVYGPDKSPYQGGKFSFEILVPEHFPSEPPQVKCLTEIWHPNMKAGPNSFKLFQRLWKDTYKLKTVIFVIQTLMRYPDLSNSENISAWKQLKERREMFEKTAAYWTWRFAGGPTPVIDLEEKVLSLVSRGLKPYRATQMLSIFDWDVNKVEKIMLSGYIGK